MHVSLFSFCMSKKVLFTDLPFDLWQVLFAKCMASFSVSCLLLWFSYAYFCSCKYLHRWHVSDIQFYVNVNHLSCEFGPLYLIYYWAFLSVVKYNGLSSAVTSILFPLIFTISHMICFCFLEEHPVQIVHYSMKSFTLQLGIQQSALCIIMSFLIWWILHAINFINTHMDLGI